jgi:hypothetical protein
MKIIALLSGSALAGFCLGLALESEPARLEQSSPAPRAPPSEAAPAIAAAPEKALPAVLPGQSDSETLSALPVEQQLETVLKWVGKPANKRTSADEAAMLRVLQTLGYEQVLALLDALSSAQSGKDDSLDFVRITLKERLAALDPKRALELGRQKNDAQLRSAAVVALMTRDAAEGFRAVLQLPEQERAGVWDLARATDKPGGSMADLAALLRESPQVVSDQYISIGLESWFAALLAKKMAVDPEGGLADMRQFAADWRAARALAEPNGQQAAAAESQPLHLTMGMMIELRDLSPEAARRVFDSLSESEKNKFIVSLEAASRLKEQGVDAAIRFAETQSAEELLKEAARGIWRGLAQQDRTAALQWVESLPAGSFRQGVFESLKFDAALRNRGSGGSPEAYQAGAELLSRNAQLDYYEFLASKNSIGLAPSELISGLPIPEADKQELRRRLVPIKVK